jgi:dextranase
LLAECAKVLEELPFDGLHIDQYGEPKTAFTAAGQPVELPAAFVSFIDQAKTSYPEKTVLFNAVGNWPIEALAGSALDFIYIEVWPPHVRYTDLAEIVRNARRFSSGKPVVIALYISADRPENVLLADALILAGGGTRIELGEDARLLADPYFPKHQPVSQELERSLRRFYDFIVRYGEWIGPATRELENVEVQIQNPVWTCLRTGGGKAGLHLVNFSGLGSEPAWDEAHPTPAPLHSLEISIRWPDRPEEVLWISPDDPDHGPNSLDFEFQSGWLKIQVVQLDLWGVVLIDEINITLADAWRSMTN